MSMNHYIGISILIMGLLAGGNPVCLALGLWMLQQYPF